MITRFKRSACFAIVCVIASACFSSATLYAQAKKNTRVIKSPKKEPYDISNAAFNCENGYRGDGKWVVFIAQEGAGSYSRPGGEGKIQTLPFMEPCYVIKKRGDYLQLVRYNNALKFRKWTRHVANWQELQYLGWVHQSKVLPWQVALRDKNNKFYIKYITALKGTEVLTAPDNYFSGDSLKVFAEPTVTGAVRKQVAMNTLLYAYKLSEDRKFYLIGTEPQCVPDSAGITILGWMPVQTVQPWGEKFYVTTPPPAARAINIDGYRPDTIRLAMPDASLNRFPTLAQTFYPVYSFRKNGDDEKIIRTTALSNVLDYQNNRVYSIVGEPVSYARFMGLKQGFRRLNIVLLVDGTSDNARFTGPVMSVLQQMQIAMDGQKGFEQISYAAAIYQGSQKCLAEDRLPLTGDYRSLSAFFETGIAGLNTCGYNGGNSVFEGITSAAELLAGHEDESNVIIVIGSNESDTRMYEWPAIINSLTARNTRLLVYQTHSDASGTYNNFVIDAKKLITESADNIIELRKSFAVENNLATDAYDFRIITGDHSVFMLDYPAKSRWQGAVVFPNKFESMPLLTLNSTLDTLLTQIHADNTATIAALDKVFESYAGNMGTQIDSRFAPVFGGYGGELPDRFYRHFRKKFDVFSFAGDVTIDSTGYSKGLLLSKDELDNLVFHMSNVMEPFNNPDYSRQRAARKARHYAKHYVRETGAKKPKSYRAMTLGDVTGLFTSMVPQNPYVLNTKLTSYGKGQGLPDTAYKQVLADMDNYYLTLKTYYNADGFRYVYAGNKTYYWIPVGM